MRISERDLLRAEEHITDLIESGKSGEAIVELFKIIRRLNDR